jgi:hypothetical protein
MTRRRPTLSEAEAAYTAQFGRGPPTWGFEGNAELPAALLEAAARKEPWDRETLQERLQIPRSPAGAIE